MARKRQLRSFVLGQSQKKWLDYQLTALWAFPQMFRDMFLNKLEGYMVPSLISSSACPEVLFEEEEPVSGLILSQELQSWKNRRLPNCHHVCICFCLGNAIFFPYKILNAEWNQVFRPAGTIAVAEENKLLEASIAAKQSAPANKDSSTPIKVQASLNYIYSRVVTPICLNSSWPMQDVLDSEAAKLPPCMYLLLLRQCYIFFTQNPEYQMRLSFATSRHNRRCRRKQTTSGLYSCQTVWSSRQESLYTY